MLLRVACGSLVGRVGVRYASRRGKALLLSSAAAPIPEERGDPPPQPRRQRSRSSDPRTATATTDSSLPSPPSSVLTTSEKLDSLLGPFLEKHGHAISIEDHDHGGDLSAPDLGSHDRGSRSSSKSKLKKSRKKSNWGEKNAAVAADARRARMGAASPEKAEGTPKRRSAGGGGVAAAAAAAAIHRDGGVNQRDLTEKSIIRDVSEAATKKSLADMTSAWHRIKRFEKKYHPNLLDLKLRSYQEIMGLFVDESPDPITQRRALEVYHRCVDRGLTPDPIMYNRYMSACANLGEGSLAKQLIQSLEQNPPDGFSPSSSFLYDLIIALSKGNYSEDASHYLGVMKDLGHMGTYEVYRRCIVTWMNEPRDMNRAVELLDSMMEAGFVPSKKLVKNILALLSSCDDAPSPHTVKVFKLFRGLGGELRGKECLKVLNHASAIGDAELAAEVWNAAGEWELQNSNGIHNPYIMASVRSGRIDEAMQMLIDLANSGKTMSDRLIQQISHLLSRSVKRIDDTYYHLAHLQENGHRIPVEALNCVVIGSALRHQIDSTFATAQAIETVFGTKRNATTYAAMMMVLRHMEFPSADNRSMLIKTADSLFDDMKAEGIEPSRDVYYRYLEILIMSKDVEKLLETVDRMKGDPYVLNKGILLLLSRQFDQWGMKEQATYWTKQLKEWMVKHPYEKTTLKELRNKRRQHGGIEQQGEQREGDTSADAEPRSRQGESY